MDAIVSAALSEICSQGPNGVSIADLWQRLRHQEPLSSSGLNLCPGVKTAVWNGVIAVPGLQFQSENGCFGSQDPCVRSLEQAERSGLRVIAAEHLRDCFVGLYDVKAADAGVSEIQRRVLDRLALARSNGVTQHELAKEFGIKGNNIFYVVRNLECRGLVVRQSTIVRTKDNSNEGENELKNTSIVHTNLIHLYRYAKHLSSQQRLEITKANTSENPSNIDANSAVDDFAGEGVKDDILVKDYLPAIKAVCEKLEEADGKVLVASDIKQALGYRGTHGHRAWRSVCNRLKDAGLVVVFNAEVNNKVVSCLRLVKSFKLNKFEPKQVGSGYDDLDSDQPVKCGKRGQITDQLLELPIENQIYDMIDAAGQNGLTVTEICKRLGLNHKKNYTRLLNMVPRFGIHLQAESYNRSMQYRVWTSRNINKVVSNGMNAKPNVMLDGGGSSMHSVGTHVDYEKSDPMCLNFDSLTTNVEISTPSKVESATIGLESCCRSPGDDGLNQTNSHGTSPLALSHGRVKTNSMEESDISSLVSASDNSPTITASLVLSNPSKLRSYPRYPCLTLTDVSRKREQRILEWLQEKKFILTVELYRWLESLDKEKHTTMARKTLARTLNKLQQEGHCKCIQVSVPVVTNCGRKRTTEVVVHKSFQNLPPELLGQIHERLRAYDMQSRGRGLAKVKNDKSVPVLTNIKRTSNHSNSEIQAVRAEAMRTNGFIIAKMVRAKLLHNFLWSYLSISPDWSDALSAGRHGYDIKNPHSTCKLFDLDVAIKAMPLELFLQVVGSTNKFDDLVELCKHGVSLSDVPRQLYKSLMDTRATGRLSWIVDILRRLKLVRLVNDGDFKDGDKIQHAALRYALELKPYIEEPLSSVPQSSGVGFLDLRPRIRHDFILKNKEAVDIYWNTLEYCYATTDPTLAVHAFPGSAVQEVFLYRSWASVRVMTVDQRAKLIKQVVKTDPNKKLSLSDSVNIAKDLNLTLEQVLRVYHDKQQSRLDRFQRDLDPNGVGSLPMTSDHASDSRGKKRRSSKCLKSNTANKESSGQKTLGLLDNGIKHADEQIPFNCSGDVDGYLDASDEDGQANMADESEHIEEDGNQNYDFIEQCAFSRAQPTRQSKFSWTDMSDGQLVIQYVRYRAALGARFHRTDWVSLPDLPAPPSACRRRMAFLNSNKEVRKAVMRLCNLLSERYVHHLSETPEKELQKHHVSGQTNQKILSRKVGISLGKIVESDGEHKWDDFEDKNVKMALDEVLQLKEMAKVEASTGGRLTPREDWPDANFDMDLQEEPAVIMSKSNGDETHNNSGKRKRRSSCHCLPGKLLKLLNEGISVSRRAYESLAVANAVELLKLVFLSTSKAPGVPNLLAETLRRYSEHDLFAAFKYLREKKYMVGGNGSQPFVLSQHFLHNISSSPFPANTGRRAVKFASWLQDKEKELMEETVYLDEDLQCGDICHLIALVCSGELFICPCLPDIGIGEAEREEICGDNNATKLNSSVTKDGIGDFISRREKGFPGMKVSLGCATISTADTVELFKNESTQTNSRLFNKSDSFNSSELGRSDTFSCSDKFKPNLNYGGITSVARNTNKSPWNAMSSYCKHLISAFSDKELLAPLNSEIFKAVSSEIRKAGDQGLSMEEISKFMAMQGNGRNMAELLVDVLQIFGLALKVNGYNSVHVVDSSFCSKYFLASLDGRYHDVRPASFVDSSNVNDNADFTCAQENKNAEASCNPNYMHKVTVLNVREEVFQPSGEPQIQSEDIQSEDFMQVEVVSPEAVSEKEAYESLTFGNSQSFRPIFPWINGDGTTNMIVFKGLLRRILGIVMQNPGIQESDILHQMDVLNPQSCRKLLELMILDNHLIVRKMHQTVPGGPTSILLNLIGSNSKKSGSVYREHFYANPMSTYLL